VRPGLLELEPRDALSPADLGGGVALLRDRPRFEVQPFPDFTGGLSVVAAGGEVTVAPAPGSGGAPRVATFDAATGLRARPDYFAGDPADRAGLLLVAPAPAPAPPVSVGDPAWFAVFLDFELATDHAAYTADVAGYFAGLPVRFTDQRPAAPPGTYGTAVIGAPTVWPGWSSGGYAATSDFAQPGGDLWTARAVYVGFGGPADAAHEIGHGFGLVHKDGTLMDAAGPHGGLDAGQLAEITAHLPGA
jgi:hypothetical protein